ncbi:MAG: DUF2784 domain-containing protein [Bacteroidetes bacterium]|nr:DUF2784 domain-containing protein [Bacteroidota bacterium]
MVYQIAADLVAVFHFTFILFVVSGGFLAIRWHKVSWFHIPTAVWGALIEFAGWGCPLTPLENKLRLAGGDSGFAGGFIEEYLLPVIYPAGMTRSVQIALGSAVIVINVSIYGYLLLRRSRKSRNA